MDLTIQTGMTMVEAVTEARKQSDERKVAGIDQVGLDEAARQGFIAGDFEESAEEGGAVVEEFYPEDGGDRTQTKAASSSIGLAEKLGAKMS